MSGLCVLYWPKLQLPDSPDFKVFSDDHPFEIYDSQFKNMFWFEKTYTVSGYITVHCSVFCFKFRVCMKRNNNENGIRTINASDISLTFSKNFL